MITSPFIGCAGMRVSRRRLYRQSKRLLIRLMARSWSGPPRALEPTVRGFLRAGSRSYLLHLAGNRAFALAAAAKREDCTVHAVYSARGRRGVVIDGGRSLCG